MISRWEEDRKGERESEKEIILKCMVAQSGKYLCYPFSILVFFPVELHLLGMVRSVKIIDFVLNGWF